MKPAQFIYHDPKSIGELTQCLAELTNAKILAGGQSLMPMLNMRYLLPDHIIDINRIPELSYLRFSADCLHVGAMTRQSDLAASELVRQRFPLLGEALAHVGHVQTRSRGTFGGSLCHLDPAAELPAVALALDANLTVSSGRGTRQLPVNEWFLAYMQPRLEPDEFLQSIALQAWPVGHGYAFVEFARRHGDFALAGAACLLTLDQSERVSRASIVAFGLDRRPHRCTQAEAALVGRLPDHGAFAVAAEAAAQVETLADAHAGRGYRRRLARTLVERALAKATVRAGRSHDA